jgi:hypothetical protein
MAISYSHLPWHKAPNHVMTNPLDQTKPGLFADLSLLEWRLLIVLQWQCNNGKRVEITNQELMDFTKMNRNDLRLTRTKLMENRRLIKATRVNRQGTSYIYEEAPGEDGLPVTGKPIKRNDVPGQWRKQQVPDDTEEGVGNEPKGPCSNAP